MDALDEGRAETGEPVLATGLMSGTSIDGIDAALIETDGVDQVRPIAFVSRPYAEPTRDRLRAAMRTALAMERPGDAPEIGEAEAEITRLHADAIAALLAMADVPASAIAVIGFHGQTIAHRPDRGWTWQIGDGAALAQATGISVVADFRSADVAAGGQGAPLLPVYHRALVAGVETPVGILNLGGIANLTVIGSDGDLVAFDTGPASALIDDWMRAEADRPYDEGGALAATGQVHEDALETLLDNSYFDQPPPKSLDRGDFSLGAVRGLSPADGAATLTAFTARSVGRSLSLLADRPRRIVAAGGGRHNRTMMRMIGEACGVLLDPVEAVGWDGDATEAEGFAYMAVRTLRGLPISFPGTTGAPHPLEGGRIFRQ